MPQFDPYVYQALVGFALFMTAILFLYIKFFLTKPSIQVIKFRDKLKVLVGYLDYIRKNPALRNFYQASIKFFKRKNKKD